MIGDVLETTDVKLDGLGQKIKHTTFRKKVLSNKSGFKEITLTLSPRIDIKPQDVINRGVNSYRSHEQLKIDQKKNPVMHIATDDQLQPEIPMLLWEVRSRTSFGKSYDNTSTLYENYDKALMHFNVEHRNLKSDHSLYAELKFNELNESSIEFKEWYRSGSQKQKKIGAKLAEAMQNFTGNSATMAVAEDDDLEEFE